MYEGREEGEVEEEVEAPRVGELTTPLLRSVLQQELGEDNEGEEEEEEEDRANLHGNDDVGVKLLLEAHGAGKLNLGPVRLHPSLNIGQLLEPTSPSCDYDPLHPLLTESEMTQPSKRSLVSYLKICQEELGYTVADCQCAHSMYQLIEAAGEGGIHESTLEETCLNLKYSCQRTLKDLVVTLINFEMVCLCYYIQSVSTLGVTDSYQLHSLERPLVPQIISTPILMA